MMYLVNYFKFFSKGLIIDVIIECFYVCRFEINDYLLEDRDKIYLCE